MSPEGNKDLIRRYIAAIDANDSDDWSFLDEFPLLTDLSSTASTAHDAAL